jgi:hypothetical protein
LCLIFMERSKKGKCYRCTWCYRSDTWSRQQGLMPLVYLESFSFSLLCTTQYTYKVLPNFHIVPIYLTDLFTNYSHLHYPTFISIDQRQQSDQAHVRCVSSLDQLMVVESLFPIVTPYRQEMLFLVTEHITILSCSNGSFFKKWDVGNIEPLQYLEICRVIVAICVYVVTNNWYIGVLSTK